MCVRSVISDQIVVQQNLDKLTSKAKKFDALKEHIMMQMQVEGCGLEEAHITWSYEMKVHSTKQLVQANQLE